MSAAALRGYEQPRLSTPPARDLTPRTSAGFEAVAFAEGVLGMDLLPWQKWLLIHGLELDDAGSFRFRTLLVLVARQNGKSTLAQVLALWRMFVDGSPLVIGTAQNLDLAEEVWSGAVDMAESVSELRAEIAAVDRTNGKKALRLAGGQRYKVAAATRRGGRGLSGDFVLLDELREHHTWDAWSAISKTTMARPRAQILGLSNAGDDHSVVLNHLRAVALRDIDRRDTDAGIFEWSAPEGCEIDDPQAWAAANPSLGYTIGEAAISSALTTDPPWVFRTEVLCQRVDTSAASPLPGFDDCADPAASVEPGRRVAFAVDVSWDRSTAWVAAAAMREDGRVHVEVVASAMGTEWVPDWLAVRLERWEPVAVALQGVGAPVSSLSEAVESAVGSARTLRLGSADLGRACGLMFDAVAEGWLVHTGQQQLTEAAKVASVRPLGDAWVFDRKKSPLDIAPLMAAAEAVWAVKTFKDAPEPSARRAGRVLAFG